MFDTLWNETELHEQLRESNKRLEIENGHLRDQDKMLQRMRYFGVIAEDQMNPAKDRISAERM